MTCDERRDLWMLLASGALDAEEERDLRAHLDGGCPRCAGALVEAEAVLAQLPLALPPIAPPAGLRERLIERVAAASRSTPVEPAEWRPRGKPAARGRWSSGRLAAAAMLAIALVTAGFVWRQSALESRVDDQARRIAELDEAAGRATVLARTVDEQAVEIERLKAVVGPAADVLAVVQEQRDEIARLTASLTEVRGTVEARDAEIRHLQRGLDSQQLRMASYRSPDVRIFSLAGTEAARNASARIFWNIERRRWDFYASGLEPAGLVKTYQLWFVTSEGRKVSAGTFDVGDDGQAELLDVQVPVDIGAVVAAGVTDEPAGGSLQPTGQMRLLGETRRS